MTKRSWRLSSDVRERCIAVMCRNNWKWSIAQLHVSGRQESQLSWQKKMRCRASTPDSRCESQIKYVGAMLFIHIVIRAMLHASVQKFESMRLHYITITSGPRYLARRSIDGHPSGFYADICNDVTVIQPRQYKTMAATRCATDPTQQTRWRIPLSFEIFVMLRRIRQAIVEVTDAGVTWLPLTVIDSVGSWCLGHYELHREPPTLSNSVEGGRQLSIPHSP